MAFRIPINELAKYREFLNWRLRLVATISIDQFRMATNFETQVERISRIRGIFLLTLLGKFGNFLENILLSLKKQYIVD